MSYYIASEATAALAVQDVLKEHGLSCASVALTAERTTLLDAILRNEVIR